MGSSGGRGGFFEDSQSRADEVDSWTSKKSFVPLEQRKHDRRGSFGTNLINGCADSDSWGKRVDDGRKTGGSFDSLRERRGVFESNGADSEIWGRKGEEVTNGSGGRPRSNLQPRTLPVEGQKSDTGSVVKPKGSKPFGEARPREEVLKEKGQDWKEIEGKKQDSTKTKEIAAMGCNDGPVVERKSFWSGNGRESLQREDKVEIRLTWFDHVKRGPNTAPIRNILD